MKPCMVLDTITIFRYGVSMKSYTLCVQCIFLKVDFIGGGYWYFRVHCPALSFLLILFLL